MSGPARPLQAALEAHGSRTHHETPRDRLWTVVAILSVLTALSGGVSLGLYFQVLAVRDFQIEGRLRTFESRAVACSNLAQDGQDLPPPCLIPEVVALYDPTP